MNHSAESPSDYIDMQRLLPWQTRQPTVPLFEADLSEADILRVVDQEIYHEPSEPLSMLAEHYFFRSYRIPNYSLGRPLPILTVRLPTQKDRVQWEGMLEAIEDKALRNAIRLVSGKGVLEGLA